MELKDIVSVSGVAGLHKVIGRNKNGLIVETIGENKKFATNVRQRVSVLADIAVFTEEGEAKLWEVIKNIKAKDDAGETVPDTKSDNDVVKAFMAAVLPGYDTEKVYVSDMKKLFTWYHSLKPVLDFSKLGVEEETTDENGEKTETPAKKTAEKVVTKKVKTQTPKTQSGAKVKTTTPRKMGS
jgi:hypothetical protein